MMALKTLDTWVVADLETDTKDKIILLAVQYVCNEYGIKLPWDEVARLVDPLITEGAVIQHLAKLRVRMMAAGKDVPPPLKRGGGSSVSLFSRANLGKAVSTDSKTAAVSKAPAPKVDEVDNSNIVEEAGPSQVKRAKYEPKGDGQTSKGKNKAGIHEDSDCRVDISSGSEEPVRTSSKRAKNMQKRKGAISDGTKAAAAETLVSPMVGEKRKRQSGDVGANHNEKINVSTTCERGFRNAGQSVVNYAMLTEKDSTQKKKSKSGHEIEDDDFVGAGARFLELDAAARLDLIETLMFKIKFGQSTEGRELLQRIKDFDDNEFFQEIKSYYRKNQANSSGSAMEEGESVVESEGNSGTGFDDGTKENNNEIIYTNSENDMFDQTAIVQDSYLTANATGYDNTGFNAVPGNSVNNTPQVAAHEMFYQGSYPNMNQNLADMGAMPHMPQAGAREVFHASPNMVSINNSGNGMSMPQTPHIGSGETFFSGPYAYQSSACVNMGQSHHTSQAGAGGPTRHMSYEGVNNNFANTVPNQYTSQAEMGKRFHQPLNVDFSNTSDSVGVMHTSFLPAAYGSGSNNLAHMGPVTNSAPGGGGDVFSPAIRFSKTNSSSVPMNPLHPNSSGTGAFPLSSAPVGHKDLTSFNPGYTGLNTFLSPGAHEGGQGSQVNAIDETNMVTGLNQQPGFEDNLGMVQALNYSQYPGTGSEQAHDMDMSPFGIGSNQPVNNRSATINYGPNSGGFSLNVQQPLQTHSQDSVSKALEKPLSSSRVDLRPAPMSPRSQAAAYKKVTEEIDRYSHLEPAGDGWLDWLDPSKYTPEDWTLDDF